MCRACAQTTVFKNDNNFCSEIIFCSFGCLTDCPLTNVGTEITPHRKQTIINHNLLRYTKFTLVPVAPSIYYTILIKQHNIISSQVSIIIDAVCTSILTCLNCRSTTKTIFNIDIIDGHNAAVGVVSITRRKTRWLGGNLDNSEFFLVPRNFHVVRSTRCMSRQVEVNHNIIHKYITQSQCRYKYILS